MQTFKPPALNDQYSRMVHVADMPGVDEVDLNDGPGRDFLLEWKPTFVVAGPDWAIDNYLKQIGMSAEEFFGLGFTLVFLPPARKPGLSSSAIRAVL